MAESRITETALANGRRGTPRIESETHLQAFRVPFSYPVVFTRDVFEPDNPALADTVGRLHENRRHRVMAFVDDGPAKAMPNLIGRIRRYAAAHADVMDEAAAPEIVPGGEREKGCRDLMHRVMARIGDRRYRMCRQSVVVAVGGGSMLDIVGLAASLVHRGLRLIRVPTTVLAQDDAGVGVKNGIDENGKKNFIGTFAPPFAVLNDITFIRTLPWKYYIGGIAEAFKVALIKDRPFFEYLSEHTADIRRRDEHITAEIIRRCALLHLEHIRTQGDPFEFGAARPLDFGHWSAHKLEALSGYAIGHGQAVAIGMALDAFYAAESGLLSAEARDRFLSAMSRAGLDLWHPLLEAGGSDGRPAVIEGLEEFREHLGGRLTVTLPDGIGCRKEVHEMDPAVIERGILFLKNRGSGN